MYAMTPHINTGPLTPTKNPPRVTQVPLRPMGCSLGQIDGLHELTDGPCNTTECPLRPAQDMDRPQKVLFGALQDLLQSVRRAVHSAWKGNSQANSGSELADNGLTGTTPFSFKMFTRSVDPESR